MLAILSTITIFLYLVISLSSDTGASGLSIVQEVQKQSQSPLYTKSNPLVKKQAKNLQAITEEALKDGKIQKNEFFHVRSELKRLNEIKEEFSKPKGEIFKNLEDSPTLEETVSGYYQSVKSYLSSRYE